MLDNPRTNPIAPRKTRRSNWQPVHESERFGVTIKQRSDIAAWLMKARMAEELTMSMERKRSANRERRTRGIVLAWPGVAHVNRTRTCKTLSPNSILHTKPKP